MKSMDRNWIMRLCLLMAGISAASLVGAQEKALEGMLEESQQFKENLRADFVPEAVDGRFLLPTLEAPSTEVEVKPDKQLPTGFRDDQAAPIAPLPESASDRGQPWNWTQMNWAAANTFSNPRYFEDRMLERHGHERWCCAQPVASGARFFLTVPMMPYLMTVTEPCECEYTLGYYSAGSCTPALMQRPPYERRAAIMEALVASGLIIGFP